MVYKVIGLMSGSSMDGLDIAYVHLQERAGGAQRETGSAQRGAGSSQQGAGAGSAQSGPRGWDFQLIHTACYPYTEQWRQRLAGAPGLSALDYQLLHAEYGHYLGEQVLRFIGEHGLSYQVQLVVSHGHTALHVPERRMTAQLGDGAAIAAVTRINVVSDLRAMDLALGGQGAPIVPVGERLLLPGYEFFLNLGGIANISRHGGVGTVAAGSAGAPGGAAGAAAGGGAAGAAAGDGFVAFDVCPANRVLNELAAMVGRDYDEGGALAAAGTVDGALLQQLNGLAYYGTMWPKSLANSFGTETVLPMVRAAMGGGAAAGGGEPGKGGLSVADALRTYTEHIAEQVSRAVGGLLGTAGAPPLRLLVTGGGAHNDFLIGRLRDLLDRRGVELIVADKELADFKEALIMALIGVLRWREENNVLASVTGASRDSIGGAVWIGQEA